MKTRTLTLRLSESATLLSILRGRAFHVTCGTNVHSIAESRAILANESGAFRSSFGSSQQSFFRLRGYVSVFDYRRVTDEQLTESLWKCAPWRPVGRACRYELAVYLLSDRACEALISWEYSRELRVFSEMIVPFVEAGYPGQMPLTLIDELLLIDFAKADAPDIYELSDEDLEAMLRRPPTD